MAQARPAKSEADVVSTISAALADTRRWSFRSDLSHKSTISSDIIASARHEQPIDEHPDFAAPYSQSRFDRLDDPLELARFEAFDDVDAARTTPVPAEATVSQPGPAPPETDSLDKQSISLHSASRKSVTASAQQQLHRHGSTTRLSGDDVSVAENPSTRETASNFATTLPEEPEPPVSLIDSYIHRLASIVHGYYQSEKLIWFEQREMMCVLCLISRQEQTWRAAQILDVFRVESKGVARFGQAAAGHRL